MLLCVSQAGVLQQLQVSLKVGAQYLMDCHVAPGVYVARVSNMKPLLYTWLNIAAQQNPN